MRIADPDGEQPGTHPGGYDVAFESVLARAEALRDRLKEVGSERQDLRLQFTQWAVVVTLLLLLAEARLLIRRRERRAPLPGLKSAKRCWSQAGEGILAVDRWKAIGRSPTRPRQGMLGFDREDLAGRSLRSLLPPASLRPGAAAAVAQGRRDVARRRPLAARAQQPGCWPTGCRPRAPATVVPGHHVPGHLEKKPARRREALREVELAELRPSSRIGYLPPSTSRSGWRSRRATSLRSTASPATSTLSRMAHAARPSSWSAMSRARGLTPPFRGVSASALRTRTSRRGCCSSETAHCSTPRGRRTCSSP